MNENEARRIAAAANMLRPDWPLASIITILGRPELAARPRRDVAVALTWIACESTTQTPARVLEAGPWWKATSVDGGSALRPQFDPRKVCSICSEREEVCRARYAADDHEFRAVERARSVRSTPPPADLRNTIAATPRTWPKTETSNEESK